jgi:hypothetical protein
MQIHLQAHATLDNSQEKYKVRHDRHRIENPFKVGDRFWLQLKKEILQGPSNNIKDMCYGPFELLGKVVDNI